MDAYVHLTLHLICLSLAVLKYGITGLFSIRQNGKVNDFKNSGMLILIMNKLYYLSHLHISDPNTSSNWLEQSESSSVQFQTNQGNSENSESSISSALIQFYFFPICKMDINVLQN